MNVSDVIQIRGIEEVLHFTTNNGLVGILRQRACKARALLRADETLIHILKLNTVKEFDPGWKEYVNLSLTRINSRLFEYSTRVNYDFRWRILSFDPQILEHPGVVFATTNNAYHQHISREEGFKGLEALFAPEVRSRYNTRLRRDGATPSNYTTDVQAEVLYPREIPISYLRKIYVRTVEEADSVYGKFSTFGLEPVTIEVNPEKFI